MGRPKKPQPTSTAESFTCPVKFGGVSPGLQYSRLGVIFQKGTKPGQFSPKLAEHYCCNSRVSVRIAIDANASNDTNGGTEKIFETAEKEIQATADIKGYKSTSKAISIGLTFNNEEVGAADLIPFLDSAGAIEFVRLGDIPEKKRGRPASGDATDDGDEDGDDQGGALV